MNRLQSFLISVLLIWLSAATQKALSMRLSLLGTPPDFMLTSLGCMSLFLSRPGSTVYGFLTGLVYGAMSGSHIGHYVASRTIAGFTMSSAASSGLHRSLGMAMFSVAVTTIIAQILKMFIAPPGDFMVFLWITFKSSIYNALLAIPLYAILSKLDRKERSGY